MTFRPKSATIVRGDGYSWSEYAPHPALVRWVSSYWTLRTGSGKHVVRTLPDGCIDLTLRLGRSPRAYLAGAQRRARRWTIEGGLRLLGARLLPGAAANLRVDASALRDEWTPLERFLPRASSRASYGAPKAPTRPRGASSCSTRS